MTTSNALSRRAMHFNLLVLAFCVIAGHAEKAEAEAGLQTSSKDVWETYRKSNVYFLLRRTYQVPGSGSCRYASVLERNEGNHSLLQLMGSYNKTEGKYTKAEVYVTTRLGKNNERNHMGVSFFGYHVKPSIIYRLLFNDGNGCSLLEVTKDNRDVDKKLDGECELWATKEAAPTINKHSSCVKVYKNKCSNKKATTKKSRKARNGYKPYTKGCKDPVILLFSC
ncbi:uncharacterized protein LOC135391780 isoform X2 [Ornithodoros turicata]|uniref:uncharacterized protein LOC135391780 isoform X2 n=1 Tax=Ornithodoros turicata TaxID=34597 RepID=UPI003138A42E